MLQTEGDTKNRPAKKGSPRLLGSPWSAAILLNLILILVFLWSLDDEFLVRIEVRGSQLTATVNGSSISVSDSQYPAGRIGLFIAGYQTGRAYTVIDREQNGIRGLLNRSEGWLANHLFPAAWRSIEVVDLSSGALLLNDSFPPNSAFAWQELDGRWGQRLGGGYRPDDTGSAVTGDPDWVDYAVRARLARGKEEAGVLVRSAEAGDGYLFWFRPEHEDMGWKRMEGYQEEGLNGGHFRLTLIQSVKATVREVLMAYWVAIALVLGFAIAVLGVGTIFKWWRRALPRLPINPGDMAFLCSIFSLIVTGYIAWDRLGGIPHVQDSVAYLFQGKVFAQGMLAAPSPPLPDFFEHEFILDKDGRWFGKYPPGHPLALSLGTKAGVPWLVGPIVSALALWIIYLIAKEVYTPWTGTIALLLALVSPFFLFLSSSFMAHSTSLLFLSLFVLCFAKLYKGAGMRWAVPGGFALGFAFITRQLSTVAIATPFLLYGLVALPGPFGERLRRYGAMALGASLPLLFLLIFNWQVAGSPLANPFTMWWPFDRPGFGDDIGGRGGHTPAEGFLNTRANLSTLMVHLFGWPAHFTLAFLFIPFITGKASRWDILLLASFAALVLAYVAYWADGIMYGPRYYYEAMPALLLLTARGILGLVGLAGNVGRLLGRASLYRATGSSLAACLVLSLVAFNLIHYMPGQWPLYKDYNYVRSEPLRKVQSLSLENAIVFVEHEPTWQWWKYGAFFSANDPLLQNNILFARDLGKGNGELMKLFPGRKFYRLREERGYFNLSELTP